MQAPLRIAEAFLVQAWCVLSDQSTHSKWISKFPYSAVHHWSSYVSCCHYSCFDIAYVEGHLGRFSPNRRSQPTNKHECLSDSVTCVRGLWVMEYDTTLFWICSPSAYTPLLCDSDWATCVDTHRTSPSLDGLSRAVACSWLWCCCRCWCSCWLCCGVAVEAASNLSSQPPRASMEAEHLLARSHFMQLCRKSSGSALTTIIFIHPF